ncbi:MAG: hypothetical protein A2015_08980 [Spirochaetes bacterium GWF1_31_7]|nr:MAG: hypothetical protein A2Y30_09240 [Spirochaetes bacterium GWE1_32_154]OHD46609.1 MAG: hypothetical protein A2Y29_07615 [Spirochaetes bacterium GWE2_31_10]OHD47623.1 MAG: hypothetical protein A2015_08980 [Spirochaetes bacterium GWF1_31_7]OHD72737.1 MAG: hypothetical protein A2355_05200 [Spirochaetes bacterium RIFOXYB1_FULL_32_8]HBD94400.1 hypothetical protein [Spirochaetia bacterium]
MIKKEFISEIPITLFNLLQKDLSSDEILHLLNQGSVWTLNRRIKDPDSIIESNTTVYIYQPEFPITEYSLQINNIQYEDDDLLIVYKDAGVNSVPTPMSDLDNILHGINKYYISQGINHKANPIHRLDCPTKGLIIFGKNKQSELKMHQLFKDRKIKKLYIAVTNNISLNSYCSIINDPIEWKGKVQDAITHISLIKTISNLSYFRVYPLTGRIHQIRKHMAKHVSPIIGDALYGKGYTRNDEMELACFYYKFKHPITNKTLEIQYLEEKFRCDSK